MRVAIQQSFAASKKEPLADVLDRIHQAFLDAGLGEPAIGFSLADPPIPRGVSSVDRVLKRFPELERLTRTAARRPSIPGVRTISLSPGAEDPVAYSTLQAIALGVPRSFPFHNVVFHLHAPEFGDVVPTPSVALMLLAGVVLTDSWWVNGRNRSLSACTVLEVETLDKTIPLPPEKIAAALKACGKVRKTVQVPLAEQDEKDLLGVRMPTGVVVPSARPQALRAVHEVVAKYRARMNEILQEANLPHTLSPPSLALRETALGVTSGPRKPALEQAFKPMGYSCKGESGTFTLRRRTAANLTIEVHLDVGTWGHKVIGMYRVLGLGFKALLPLPVASDAVMHSQYPIGDSAQWQKITQNLAALVAYYERTFVPEVERAAGPSPEWYHPET